ncbi:DUF3419 family protein [Pseudobacteriovorax antillogorgiicola]|uniref:S-adenosylmethionine-diacylglycerol 3-amino-3-carboxypropyl transferase n=1 Tax=Pseudobacteriovorax antillogorgiicola TaxID=1513793 RepID=A0A1Y6CLJ6_9BACT|nr:DUF3419 family protein [Pseudobacteriovorax antillogorgiicola]TCS45418.1 S-adenosylmethionine-diacylglycerol 3-amino-3-carboxypropyl transferase [Pseudobacteriovorax antillogorgiicola]SMF74096.1 S-adenosylmethionine-diacylglycerol 3-amino-3-carboxypropyl transferase [Pseudobacteriovorax antillogorgiicola]
MTKSYFASLNYSLANEDASVETQVLPLEQGHVAVVAGSGSRAIPLLSRKPQILSCYDVSQEQLYLCELRVEAVRTLDYADYLEFLGYEPCPPNKRMRLFSRLSLSSDAKAYLHQLFEQHGWHSILYEGRWEKFMLTMNKVVRKFVGSAADELFEQNDLADQQRFIESSFPQNRFRAAVFLLGNSLFYNSILYRGSFPEKNIPDSYYRFYLKVFQRLFSEHYARQNFYLNLLFLGRIGFPCARPPEAQESVYSLAQNTLKDCEVRYKLGCMISQASKIDKPLDYVSLSNVPSYLKPPMEQSFLQALKAGLSEHATVIFRSYIRIPFRLDTQGFECRTQTYQSLLREEQTQMYFIDIYKRLGS